MQKKKNRTLEFTRNCPEPQTTQTILSDPFRCLRISDGTAQCQPKSVQASGGVCLQVCYLHKGILYIDHFEMLCLWGKLYCCVLQVLDPDFHISQLPTSNIWKELSTVEQCHARKAISSMFNTTLSFM